MKNICHIPSAVQKRATTAALWFACIKLSSVLKLGFFGHSNRLANSVVFFFFNYNNNIYLQQRRTINVLIVCWCKVLQHHNIVTKDTHIWIFFKLKLFMANIDVSNVSMFLRIRFLNYHFLGILYFWKVFLLILFSD